MTTMTTMTPSLFQTTIELDRFHVFLRAGNNTVSTEQAHIPGWKAAGLSGNFWPVIGLVKLTLVDRTNCWTVFGLVYRTHVFRLLAWFTKLLLMFASCWLCWLNFGQQDTCVLVVGFYLQDKCLPVVGLIEITLVDRSNVCPLLPGLTLLLLTKVTPVVVLVHLT